MSRENSWLRFEQEALDYAVCYLCELRKQDFDSKRFKNYSKTKRYLDSHGKASFFAGLLRATCRTLADGTQFRFNQLENAALEYAKTIVTGGEKFEWTRVNWR